MCVKNDDVSVKWFDSKEYKKEERRKKSIIIIIIIKHIIILKVQIKVNGLKQERIVSNAIVLPCFY